MATYVNNLRLKEITTGDEDGTWGTSTNVNLELIGDGLGYGTEQVAADSNETFTMADGVADGMRGMYLKFTSAGSLSATRTLTLAPNTVSKLWIIENATTGGQIITIKQGAGATINVANGAKKMVYTDGAGSGAAVFNANPGNGDTGSGALTFATSPTFVTPALGTPASGTATNLTGLPPAGVTGTAAILGANTFTALQTEAAGADIASATATDLTGATGNVVVITGTTTATSLTMTAGQQMILIAAAAWPLTFHATTMNITGGVSYTCAAGDRLYVTKDVDNVIRVSVLKQDGTSVVAGVASSVAVGNITGAGTGVLTALAVNVGSAGAPAVLNGVLGTPSSGTLSGCTVDGVDAVGFKNIPQNSKSADYTLVLADAGKHIFHPSTDASIRTYTIPANASVAYAIGTAVVFVNMTSQVVSIAITSDTMYLAKDGTTGTRSLAQYGSATALKITATKWIISGSALT